MKRDVDPPQNWEALAARDPDWLSQYGETNGLERWEREALRVLEVEQKAAKAPLSLDDVKRVFSPLVTPEMGVMEREVLSGLAVCLWGADHVEAMREKRRRKLEGAAPFGSMGEVLAVALRIGTSTGVGAVRLESAESTGRPNPARVGYDYPQAKQSANGSTGGCKGLAGVERRVDAQRGVAMSLLGPTEVWMLTAVVLGEFEKWPKAQGGKMGMLVKRKPWEVARAYRARICTHVGGVGIAVWCEGDAHVAPCPAALDTAGNDAVTKRIARVRERLTTALVAAGLIPEPDERETARREKKKAERVQPPPMRATFASDWKAES